MGAHRKGRKTEYVLDPRRLKYPVGKHYKGEVETLRRAITRRSKCPVYLYLKMPMIPVTLVLSPEEIQEPGLDLIGAYDKQVTTAMLKEDLPFSSITLSK